jgi:predicted peroxiredoxin
MATVVDQGVVVDQSTARIQAVAKKRPTETLTIAGAAAFVLARVFGVENDNTMTALAVVIGFLPAAITWLVHLFVAAPGGAAVTARQAGEVLDVAPFQELQTKIASALEELGEQTKKGEALPNLQTKIASALEELVEQIRTGDAPENLRQRTATLTQLLTSLRAMG